MDLGIRGKAALVTGASRGLGRAVAEALLAEGVDVAISARTAADLDRARDEMVASTGGRVVAIAGDLSTEAGPGEVVRAALESLGRIDVLVLNSGGPPAGPFEAHDRGAWRAALASNFESAVELVRAALPGMKQRGWGRIIAITSIAAKQPVDGLILSNASRAAVTGFARTLANEVAAHGITVNTVLPGYTRTRRVETLAENLAAARGCAPSEVVEGWTSQVPAGRLGEPAELGAMVAFLASERASYITGTSIPVDGGWIRSLL
ncbi:MAG TPA: SDR family oxidoreductase [Kofleriaceae bacterium]|nr:SDR family oxidoreductase [Kofleriaceae bacterium]